MTLSIGVVICGGTIIKQNGTGGIGGDDLNGYGGGSNGYAEAPGVGSWDDWEE